MVGGTIVNPLLHLLLSHHAPCAEYLPEDISPFFWPNGKMPTSDDWKALEANGFRDYRLKIYGLVDNVCSKVRDLLAHAQDRRGAQ